MIGFIEHANDRQCCKHPLVNSSGASGMFDFSFGKCIRNQVDILDPGNRRAWTISSADHSDLLMKKVPSANCNRTLRRLDDQHVATSLRHFSLWHPDRQYSGVQNLNSSLRKLQILMKFSETVQRLLVTVYWSLPSTSPLGTPLVALRCLLPS